MKGKILFVVGLGVGYVLGTRAGRERYEQIRKAAENVWNRPEVQQGVGTVTDFAKSRVGDLSETVLDGVKGLIGNATKSTGSTTSTTSSTSTTSATRPSPTTSKPPAATGTTAGKRSSTSRGEKLTPPTGTATNPATSPDSSGA